MQTLAASIFITFLAQAGATNVPLQQATATLSQTSFGGQPVGEAIDGIFGGANGWAIFQSGVTNAETAVFETASDIGFASGGLLTFTLTQTFSNPGHTLGRFRLSVTRDNRSTFADGLASGGDVTANWTVLEPISLLSANGTTLTTLGDFSILASGLSPATDVYTITAATSLTGISGVRLEALEDPSLPTSGPGRFASNGNFVLTEFQLDIVPEPASTLLLLSGAALCLRGRSLRKDQRSA